MAVGICHLYFEIPFWPLGPPLCTDNIITSQLNSLNKLNKWKVLTYLIRMGQLLSRAEQKVFKV